MEDSFQHKAKTWDQQAYRVERARVVADAIRQVVPLTKADRLLDFGCGTGLLGLGLAGDVGTVVLADTSPAMLDQVAQKITAQGLRHVQTRDLGREGLGEGYSVIVSLMVLHHIEDVAAEVARLAAALSPGGALCLCDLETEDGSFHTDEVVPHNGFDPAWVAGLMGSHGLRVVASKTVFMNRKAVAGGERDFPVFLVAGVR